MTSECRSYLILAASTVAAVCAFGQSVEEWTLRAVFGVIGVAAGALVNGFAKSPRDAKMTDEMEGEVVSAESVTKTTETETVTKATPQT